MADDTTRKGRLYGRKWKILIFRPAYTTDDNGNQVRDPDNDIQMDVSLLKCTFKTKSTTESVAGLCTLVVYNMNAATEKEVIQEGFQISIYGGYDEGQYGELFTGDIVQVIRNRENGIDYRLEIVALRGILFASQNYIRTAIAANSSPRDVINTIADKSAKKIGVGEVSENLSEQTLPRGKVLFGTPAKYLRDICVFNDAAYWQGNDGKLTVQKIEDEIPEDQEIVLSPLTGLVGTPMYGDDGIHIKMLLDARVDLRSMIKIDNEIIQKIAINYDLSGSGNNNQMPQQLQFDKDGEYQVFSVSHSGDTWGDAWYTEVIAIGRNGRLGLLTAVKNSSQTMR